MKVSHRDFKYFTLFMYRIFFLVSFIVALSLAINFIYNIYVKWSATPVIIAISATPTYINTIPFPAIIVCNMNQALSSKVTNLDRKSTSFSILQTVCSRDEDYRSEVMNASNDWSTFENFLYNAMQPCRSMLLLCRFGSINYNCSDLFRSVLTDEGRCCSFNTVDPAYLIKTYREDTDEDRLVTERIAVDWTPDLGYPSNLPKTFYPATAAGTGSSMGLTIILDADIKNYYCSSTNGAGFKVLLHNPIEIPNVGETGISVKAGYETRVVITPLISDASVTLQNVAREYRQCLFASEGNLSFFRTYSRRNCEKECEAGLVATECKCVQYYMPRISPNISICGIKDNMCFDKVIIRAQVANQNENNCSRECLPGCYDLTYNPTSFSAPIAQGDFALKERIVHNMPKGYAATNIAVVHFYYTENFFRSNRKEQFVGFTEFLSSTGGLMGLFIGFSIVSVMEIIYYASFRPFFAHRRYKAQHRQTKPISYNRKIVTRLQKFQRSVFINNLNQVSGNDDEKYTRKFKRMQGFNNVDISDTLTEYLP